MYFKPYEGEDPYIFVSYAHADSDDVMRVISDMHERGFNIWYDEGIEAGSVWTESIGSHLAGASLMIGFVSDSYMASDNCRREMNFAVQKKKRVINIFLSETALTPGMELQIGGIWALMKYTYPSEEYFFDKLYSSPALYAEKFGGRRPEAAVAEDKPAPAKKEKRKQAKSAGRHAARSKKGINVTKKTFLRTLALVLAAGLAVAAFVLYIIGSRTGFIDRTLNRLSGKPGAVAVLDDGVEAKFKDPVLEAAAREYSGVKTGSLHVSDLSGLTELRLCGNDCFFGGDCESPEVPGDVTEYGGLERGSVSSLSDLAYFKDLQSLTLSFQSLNSLASLPESNITSLDVSSCRLTSLDGIGALPLLKHLDASSNSISDISDISSCTQLESLDLRGSRVGDYTPASSLHLLSELKISGASLPGIKALIMCGSLTSVYFSDCDLRGEFFDFMDSPKIMYLTLENCTLDRTEDIEKLDGLKELTLINVAGVNNWYELDLCPSLTDVIIDGSMEKYFTGRHNYDITILTENGNG